MYVQKRSSKHAQRQGYARIAMSTRPTTEHRLRFGPLSRLSGDGDGGRVADTCQAVVRRVLGQTLPSAQARSPDPLTLRRATAGIGPAAEEKPPPLRGPTPFPSLLYRCQKTRAWARAGV